MPEYKDFAKELKELCKKYGVRIVAKVWQGDEEPKEAQLQHDESEKLPPGKAGVWGMPFSGTPIRFDDLRITPAP